MLDNGARVLILGAGGHGQVVADILLHGAERGDCPRPFGFLDDDPSLHGQVRLGIPVLGAISELAGFPHDAVILGVGNNAKRRSLYCQLQSLGEEFAIARHPRATIGYEVGLGSGCIVCAGAIVSAGSRVGANAIINTGSTLDHHNWLGEHVHVGPGAHLGGDVSVGSGTLIGMGAIVMPGRNIGDWCVIGAGALVLKDVESGAVVAGLPARVVRHDSPSIP